jgi:hypothetical protein
MYLAFMSPCGEALRRQHPSLAGQVFPERRSYARRVLESALRFAFPSSSEFASYVKGETAEGVWDGRYQPVSLLRISGMLPLDTAMRVAAYIGNLIQSDAVFLGSTRPADLPGMRITEIRRFLPEQMTVFDDEDSDVDHLCSYLASETPHLRIHAFVWHTTLIIPRFPAGITDAMIDDIVRGYREFRHARDLEYIDAEAVHADRHGWLSYPRPVIGASRAQTDEFSLHALPA